MKKLIVALTALFAITACGSNGSKEAVTTVCTNESPYLMYESGVQTLTSNGDKISSMKVEAVLELGDKAMVDEVIAQSESLLADANSLEGVEASVTRVNDTQVLDILAIDVETAGMDTLVNLGVIENPGSQKVSHLSLKATIENLESMGFSCKAE